MFNRSMLRRVRRNIVAILRRRRQTVAVWQNAEKNESGDLIFIYFLSSLSSISICWFECNRGNSISNCIIAFALHDFETVSMGDMMVGRSNIEKISLFLIGLLTHWKLELQSGMNFSSHCFPISLLSQTSRDFNSKYLQHQQQTN